MIVRIIRWAIENVIDVQEIEIPPDAVIVEFQTMSDVRLRMLKQHEPAPVVYEEPEPQEPNKP